jgi:hypothetical protein
MPPASAHTRSTHPDDIRWWTNYGQERDDSKAEDLPAQLEFDGSTSTIRIPMTWKRRGGLKVIIAPDDGDAWPSAKPRPDERLIRALSAGAWVEKVAGGRHVSIGWGDH